MRGKNILHVGRATEFIPNGASVTVEVDDHGAVTVRLATQEDVDELKKGSCTPECIANRQEGSFGHCDKECGCNCHDF